MEKSKEEIIIKVTRTHKLRAKIKLSGYSYEVTIGGEEWKKGKGKKHAHKIYIKAYKLLKQLGVEWENALHNSGNKVKYKVLNEIENDDNLKY